MAFHRAVIRAARQPGPGSDDRADPPRADRDVRDAGTATDAVRARAAGARADPGRRTGGRSRTRPVRPCAPSAHSRALSARVRPRARRTRSGLGGRMSRRARDTNGAVSDGWTSDWIIAVAPPVLGTVTHAAGRSARGARRRPPWTSSGSTSSTARSTGATSPPLAIAARAAGAECFARLAGRRTIAALGAGARRRASTVWSSRGWSGAAEAELVSSGCAIRRDGSPRARGAARVRATGRAPGGDPRCVVQIESAAGAAEADRIAAVEGVEALVVGCADLAADTGERLADASRPSRRDRACSETPAGRPGSRSGSPGPTIPQAAHRARRRQCRTSRYSPPTCASMPGARGPLRRRRRLTDAPGGDPCRRLRPGT